MSKTSKLKPCPFCGSGLDVDDSDTLHPSGTAWLEVEGLLCRRYVSYKESPNWCYEVHCCTHYGGCGASIAGDSRDEAIRLWNRRVEC